MITKRSSGSTIADHPTKTILIVDDDKEFREALEEIVRGEGFEVETATSGMQALDKLRWGLRPCVVLLDLQMAGMNGWDFRAEQERDPTLAQVPVIAMTAGYWKTRDLKDYAARITKPIAMQELRTTLAKYA